MGGTPRLLLWVMRDHHLKEVEVLLNAYNDQGETNFFHVRPIWASVRIGPLAH